MPKEDDRAMPFLIPDDRLLAMLREDVPYGDATTPGLGIGDRHGQAVFRTRATMTACCIEEAERIMQLAGCGTTRRLAASGAQVEAGADLLVAEGQAAALHRGMKVAQTLIEITSGIATRARRILCAARQGRAGVMVACTRKHLPGAKDVMLKAIDGEGAISAAGRALGMSYKRAWDLVNALNKVFGVAVVSASTGGYRGGGATLTDAGRNLVADYHAIERAAQRAAEPRLLALLRRTQGA
jgi:molybdate transport repressor ModE-like protein